MNSHLLLVTIAVLLLTFSATALAVIDDEDQLYVGPLEIYTLGGVHSYNVSVHIDVDGLLLVAEYNGSANTGYVELRAPTITVDGAILGDGCGFRGSTTLYTDGEGPGGGSYPGGGGAYGGAGGASGWGNQGGSPYGTAGGRDIQMGSGGGCQGGGVGGDGGGMVALIADEIIFSYEGIISVRGDDGQDHATHDGGGAGAGGGIYLQGIDVTTSGLFLASGGDGGNCPARKGGGGGGGGRIKIFFCTFDDVAVYDESGGAGGIGGTGNGQPGGMGTLHGALAGEPTITSIVDVGNDQGRQARITWNRSCLDDPEEPDPVTHYAVWRRIDELRSTGEPHGHERLAYPPGDWDFILDVPARGEDEYNAVVPTLADSNATGMHWSVFFVSGVTDDPFVYHDSAPDSGYSVDNLAPAPPAAFALTRVDDTNEMVWEESPEEDFAYYTLHRGESEGFVPDEDNLVATLIETTYDDVAPILSFYTVAAVDFNGNVSLYALALPDVVGVPDEAGTLALALRIVSPVSDQVIVEFVLPTGQPANLRLYDVAGRLVSDCPVSSRAPGQYSAVLADRSELASGVYFVHLAHGGDTRVGRVVVLK